MIRKNRPPPRWIPLIPQRPCHPALLHKVASAPKEENAGALSNELRKKHSGLEVLIMLLAGKVSYPAMAEIIPFRLIEVDLGQAIFESFPSAKYNNTSGIVHGGFALTLLDTCMGIAIYSRLGPGVGYTSIETKVNFVRPITERTGRLRSVGQAIHVGKRTATAEGKMIDEAGKVFAHGTTTCLLFPLEEQDSSAAAKPVTC